MFEYIAVKCQPDFSACNTGSHALLSGLKRLGAIRALAKVSGLFGVERLQAGYFGGFRRTGGQGAEGLLADEVPGFQPAAHYADLDF